MSYSTFKDKNLAKCCDELVNKITNIRNTTINKIQNKKYKAMFDKKLIAFQKEVNKINHEENI